MAVTADSATATASRRNLFRTVGLLTLVPTGLGLGVGK
jgi:hypothetical protein